MDKFVVALVVIIVLISIIKIIIIIIIIIKYIHHLYAKAMRKNVLNDDFNQDSAIWLQVFIVNKLVSLCPISDLRLDTLSQILTMSNVRAHCRMLVVESCQGMVVGALLDRMGGWCLSVCIYLIYFWCSIRLGT